MYHKISKDIFDAQEAASTLQPMESLTVTGHDFKVEGFKSVPRPPTMLEGKIHKNVCKVIYGQNTENCRCITTKQNSLLRSGLTMPCKYMVSLQ
ncbi:sperm associated antigen 8 isoform X2 [Rhincodon typus]|uniref:sperm associated antigen 8 isoform X2 n=1 Tax=Rhincodon typus TaxID=259920 RepID=UPI00202E1413|nr:sperm associated antigen 8 isoform X2 [Rhincodon typus]